MNPLDVMQFDFVLSDLSSLHSEKLRVDRMLITFMQLNYAFPNDKLISGHLCIENLINVINLR